MVEGAPDRYVLDLAGFRELLEALQTDGFELRGPTVRDGAIVLDRISGVDDLPRGVGDIQRPGHYRLRDRGDEALFGWAVPAQPWKREFFPARVELVQIRRKGASLEPVDATEPARRVAAIGARPCEVAAISVQDVVLRKGEHPDSDYVQRRTHAFVLAVNCGTPSESCFCTSMGTGPRAAANFDLAATELLEPTHRFVVEVGSAEGARLLTKLDPPRATQADLEAARAVVDDAAEHMGRALSTDRLPERLLDRLEHPRWDDVAERCLGCGSCTLACPTCFCTKIEDSTSLDGVLATRTRAWDSCFTLDFAYINGESIRPTLRSRYRQWLTHKLATWHEQFGTSGCVGCGRCITWCPVGIDITEEATAVTES